MKFCCDLDLVRKESIVSFQSEYKFFTEILPFLWLSEYLTYIRHQSKIDLPWKWLEPTLRLTLIRFRYGVLVFLSYLRAEYIAWLEEKNEKTTLTFNFSFIKVCTYLHFRLGPPLTQHSLHEVVFILEISWRKEWENYFYNKFMFD